ncbi:MAG TPA: glycosyltransferase family 2 protein [Chloroflexia bacterium]|nr:glycosyltransferase family 2 protein [Chloroflexia bacterium]
MQEALSIVLPAYNEEANIELATRRALAVLPEITSAYEVIIVNDGSRDRTRAVAEDLARQYYPHVRVLNHQQNRGYGAALRTGFRQAHYDLVFFTDSDNQFDVGELKYFLPLMRQYDIMTGFRVYRFDPVLRSLISWCWNRLVGVLFRLRVRDVDCAFKIFRREALDKLTVECDNFFVCTELLAKARKWNFRIGEKGVRHYPRMAGETTVRASDIPRTLREVFRMWQRIYFPNQRQMRAAARKPRPDDNAVEFHPPASPGRSGS